MERREALRILGGAALTLATPGARRTAYGARIGLDRIGLQLYTVRSELAKDFEGTLARVAQVGYREVEFAGYHDHVAKDVRAVLDRHGLAAPSGHVPKDALRGDPDRLLADAATVGHRYLCVAWIPEAERRTLAGWKRVAEDLNRIGERCRRAGLQFAYHNHDFEFVLLEGRIPYDVLLTETDPTLVQLEIDVYWITKGGQDPVTYFARYPGRVPLVHVKDSAGPPEHRMVDVGRGVVDWKRIFAWRAQAGIQHYFVEHDRPADPLAFARTSYEYLKRLEL